MSEYETDLRRHYQGLFDQSIALVGVRPERFKPGPNRLLVRQWPKTEQTKKGIFIPDMSQLDSTIGVVLAVGSGENCLYRPGDTIVFRAGCGEQLPLEDAQELVLLTWQNDVDDDILGKLELDSAGDSAVQEVAVVSA